MTDITETKPGVKTTEFWLTLAAVIWISAMTLINEAFGLSIDVVETLATVSPVLLYVLSRTGVKFAGSLSTQKLVNTVSSILEKQPAPEAGEQLNLPLGK